MLTRILRRVWRDNFLPFYLRHWLTRHQVTPMQKIHHWVGQHHFHWQALWVSLPLRWLMALVWPLRLIHSSYLASQRFGAVIKTQNGKNTRKQVAEQIQLALRHQVSPTEYYQLQFYLDQQSAQADDFLLQHEVTPLSQALNFQQMNEWHTQIINDKAHFAAFCQAYHLPHPPTLALFGGSDDVACPSDLPPTGPGSSVFVKPRRGARGEGAMLYKHLEAAQYQQPDGATVSWPVAQNRLQQKARDNGLIMQPLLFSHPDMRDLSLNALSVVRVLTGLTPEGKAIAIAATFKMPLSAQQWHSAVALNSPVALATGRLGSACRYHPRHPRYDHHPCTKADITDRVLPDWHNGLKQTLTAHERLTGFVFLGWDLALTANGPVLLEANAGWESIMIQKPQQKPLGQTVFTDICHLWMDQ